MRLRSRFLLVVLATTLGGGAAGFTAESASAAATAAPPRTRGPLFSPEEIAHHRAMAAERERRRQEAYIRTPEEDVIVLEPYVVEGDDSLLLARIRRELDLDRYSRSRPPADLPLETQRELALARRADDLFFRGPSPGAPPEHLNCGIDLLRAPGAILSAFRERRLGVLFRAPGPTTGR